MKRDLATLIISGVIGIIILALVMIVSVPAPKQGSMPVDATTVSVVESCLISARFVRSIFNLMIEDWKPNAQLMTECLIRADIVPE